MRIHFVGIGGIGMSALAQIALKTGHSVTGSDIKENILTERLYQMGVQIFIGHNQDNLCSDIDVVVHSAAIPFDNVELIKAEKNNIPIWERAQMLRFLAEGKKTIAVTGSHGKTTTTSLIAHILISAGLKPSVAAGGVLTNIDDNAILGEGKYFIAEADESDGSFLYYEPTYSIITNIDYEHLDYYRDIDAIKYAFKRFIDKTKNGGSIFCCGNDSNLVSITDGFKNKFLFGIDSNLDIVAYDIELFDFKSEFNCIYKKGELGRFSLGIAGLHNVYNALAAVGVSVKIGIDKDIIAKALSSFRGTRRRFQVKFRSDNLLVIDDYAHHPTEIQATLNACKNIRSHRLIVVFQPHRYSRTKHLFDKFITCFNGADLLFITDIYAASEESIEGINSQNLVEAIRRQSLKNAEFLNRDNIVKPLLNAIKSEDLVVFLGAGDITKVCDNFVERLRNEKKSKLFKARA